MTVVYIYIYIYINWRISECGGHDGRPMFKIKARYIYI